MYNVHCTSKNKLRDLSLNFCTKFYMINWTALICFQSVPKNSCLNVFKKTILKILNVIVPVFFRSINYFCAKSTEESSSLATTAAVNDDSRLNENIMVYVLMKYLLFILSNKFFLIHRVSSYLSEILCNWLF